MHPDLILINGKFATLDRAMPDPEAVAITDGRFSAVGDEIAIRQSSGPNTRVIDLHGRRAIPGLIDSHLHVIRGGLTYTMELRWDGVRSLAEAMRMLKAQVDRTPAPQWVRVVGGFTEHQFAEKRLPTIDELNQVAPDTPVFVLHLYDRALLNGAALRSVGYTKDTPNPPGGEIVRDSEGRPTGLLLARPNASLLYATLAKGPRLPAEYQKSSTRHFMRELNRLGVTGAIDAGGGFQNYPDDYAIVEELHRDGQLTVRLAYNLFTQKPKQELADFTTWTSKARPGQGDDLYRNNGAGEMLVYSAADFEDFRFERPEMPPSMERDLEAVVRLLAERRWPWRMHATYDETISRALDVFERVSKDVPFDGLNWFFDHAETISDRNIERVARLGGGIAVQHRMAYQGEYFVERCGARAAEATPPIARMLARGVKVSGGTDATRVASYNPWVSLAWSPEADIADTSSLLSVVGGRVVWAAGRFASEDAGAPPPAMLDWSPVRRFGSDGAWADGEGRPLQSALKRDAASCICDALCGVHGHRHANVGAPEVPAADARGFWGALGCACWAARRRSRPAPMRRARNVLRPEAVTTQVFRPRPLVRRASHRYSSGLIANHSQLH
jgi:predicted amidohydrolase YtcJ